MAMDLYNIGARVRYADFLAALRDTTGAILSRQGYQLTGGVDVGTDAYNPHTASIGVDRNGQNQITGIQLNMPNMGPDTQISGSLARDLLGFVMHELGHAMWTNTRAQLANDTTLARQIGQAAGIMDVKEAQQLTHKLQGVFEDYFIERKASADPSPIAQGASSLLGALNAEVMTGADEGAANPNPVQAAIAYAMSQIDRQGRQGQQTLLDLATAGQDNVAPEVRKVVDDLLDQLDQLADENVTHPTNVQRTTQRVNLIKDAVNQLVQLPEQPPQGQDEQSGDGDGEGGSDDDSEGQPQGSGPGTGSGSSKAGKKPQKREPEAPKSKDDQLKDRIADKTDVPEVGSPEAYDTAYAMATEMGGAGAGGDKGKVVRRSRNRADVAIAARAANARRFADASRRALYSPDTVTVSRRLQTGRMDRRAITRAATGALDVFTRKRLDVGQRTAVVVMIDCSGSMDNSVRVAGTDMTRLAAVNGTTAVIVPAIERAGGEVAVGIFSGDGAYEIKPWNQRILSPERWIEEQGDLETFGGTPMLEGMLWAEQQMRSRTRATRKVCIWLCDGAPDGGYLSLARKIANQTGGIEHVGIGIQCDLSQDRGYGIPLFPANRAITVQDLSRLAPAFETVLFRMGQETERRLARR